MIFEEEIGPTAAWYRGDLGQERRGDFCGEGRRLDCEDERGKPR